MVGLPRISITLFDKDIAFGVNPLSIRGANIPSTNTKQVSGWCIIRRCTTHLSSKRASTHIGT
ncbi:hypothetical protein [Anaplasma phagocytophilum]|nr:hypothetical protein [Anaplasma phagocytophilum]